MHHNYIIIIIISIFFSLYLNCSISTSAFKLELTVSYFCALSVCGSGVDMSSSEQQSYLHSLIVYTLEWSANIYRQLSKLLYCVIIYEVGILLVRAIEYNPHNCLSCSHRAVCFHMHFIYTYSFTFPYKSIKHILAEVLTFDYHLFLLWMTSGVKCGQCIDTIGHLRYSGCD